MKIKMKLMLFFVLSIFLVLKEVRSATHQKQTQLIEEEWETFKASNFLSRERVVLLLAQSCYFV